jgi:ribosomal protein S6E (S10)
MLHYYDDVLTLSELGLNSEYIAIITGLNKKYVSEKYPSVNAARKIPGQRDIAIVEMLLRKKSAVAVLKKFEGYDLNLLFEAVQDKIISFNVETGFDEDFVRMISEGLSLRNTCLLFAEANGGYTPDHSSIRRRMIKKSLFDKEIPVKTSMGIKDKGLCLRLVRKHNLRPVIEDFMRLYYRFFDSFKPNQVFSILYNAADLEINKCSACGKEIFGSKYNRFCNSCRRRVSYRSA